MTADGGAETAVVEGPAGEVVVGPGGDDRRARRRAVARVVRSHRRRVGTLAASSLVAGLAEAAFLVVVTLAALAVIDGADHVAVASRQVSMGTAIGIAAALLAVRSVLAVANVRLSTSLTLAVSTELRKRLADAYLHTSWALQQSERSGHLQQLLSDFAQKTLGVVSSLAAGITAGLSLVALVSAALVVDPWATLVVVVALAVLGSVLAPLRGRIRKRSTSASSVTMQFATTVSELGSMGLEMQSFGRSDQFAGRIHGLIEAEAAAWRRADVLRNAVGPIYTSLGYAALLAGLGLATLVGVGELDAVGVVILLMLRCLGYGQSVQVASANLVNALPYLEAMDATVARYEADPAPVGDVPVEHVAPIVVEDLAFAYQEGLPVLDDVSFTIQPGEAIGIVGPSGGGKSTLVQLLLGLRTPASGRITVGGVDLATADRASWTSQVAFVPQEALLFSGTVAENIAFFRDDVTAEAVERAARAANLHDDVIAFPDGYDTPVGERGGRLSGGQKQRLAIARALVGQPQLLVLDEPTSALDVASERLVRDTLASLKGTVTSVVIAHRLTTLEVCDRTMVIDGGRVVAFDRPDVVAGANPFFRRALELSGLS